MKIRVQNKIAMVGSGEEGVSDIFSGESADNGPFIGIEDKARNSTSSAYNFGEKFVTFGSTDGHKVTIRTLVWSVFSVGETRW